MPGQRSDLSAYMLRTAATQMPGCAADKSRELRLKTRGATLERLGGTDSRMGAIVSRILRAIVFSKSLHCCERDGMKRNSERRLFKYFHYTDLEGGAKIREFASPHGFALDDFQPLSANFEKSCKFSSSPAKSRWSHELRANCLRWVRSYSGYIAFRGIEVLIKQTPL